MAQPDARATRPRGETRQRILDTALRLFAEHPEQWAMLAENPLLAPAAVEEVDRRLLAEIRELQRHRQRIARLAAGDSLALPAPVVTYLDRMRELGFPQRLVEVERPRHHEPAEANA